MFFQAWQRYCQEVTKSFFYDPPDWSLDHEVVWQTPNLKLLKFQEGDQSLTTTLVVPPNAGHHSNIAEKLISKCIEYGGPVYSIEWLSASCFNYSIDDMVSDIYTCSGKSGKPVHFISLCQGAWATAICIALFPDCAASYTNAAGPINFHPKEEGKIDYYSQLLPMDFYRNMVQMGGGVQPGDFQILGFKNMNPYERWMGDYMDLFRACLREDEKAIKNFHRFKKWYEYGINLAGLWFLQSVKLLFKKNLLIQGKLKILGELVRLENLNQIPIFLVAGSEDDITLPDQVFDLEQKTSVTKKFLIREVGHIGVFASRKSDSIWGDILEKLFKERRGENV